MPKTMREQLEESFETEEEKQEAGGPNEDPTESLGDPEEGGSGEEAIVDEPGADEGGTEGAGDEPVPPADDEPGDETPPEDLAEGPEDSKPPVSWKPAIREHWKKLPADVKAEINRREGDIQKGLQQASSHRKVADEYLRTVQPFQGLMQSMGTTPSQAITTVLGTVSQLASGTVNQKAQIVGQLIKDYGVDVVTLDQLLSGGELLDDPSAPLMGQLDEKLKPIYDFMGQMNGYQEKQTSQVHTQATADLQTFVSDPANEFLEDVRPVMADYLEVAATNGRLMTLKEAYDRACQDDPGIRKVLAQRTAARRATPTGDELTRKRRAASGLSGSPNSGGGGNAELDLHQTIAAQFEDT